MIKKIMSIVMPVIILAFLIGCAQPEMSKQTIVKNANVTSSDEPVITTSEKAILESLKPQVNQIITSVLGEERAKSFETANITQDEMNQMDAQLKALLKSKFGNDIERFFVTKKLTPKKAVLENAALKDMKYNNPADLIGCKTIGSCTYYYFNKITVYSVTNAFWRFNKVSQGQFSELPQFRHRPTIEYFIPSWQAIAVVDDVTPYPGKNNTCYSSEKDNKLTWDSNDNLYVLYAYANQKQGYYLSPGTVTVYSYIVDPNVTNGSTYYAVCFYF